jgi:hypothetical protein
VFGDEIGVGTQPVTGALDLDDDGVVQQTIQQGGCDDRIAEDSPHSAKPRLEVRIMAPFS